MEAYVHTDGRADDGIYNDGRNVYVVGLNPNTKGEELAELCNKYGVVETCQLVTDPKTRMYTPTYSNSVQIKTLHNTNAQTQLRFSLLFIQCCQDAMPSSS